MKIVNETELMYNQKASQTIAPDVQFEALQTSSGNSLVFSLGANGNLTCTCEVPGDTHGWKQVGISPGLTLDQPFDTLTVKAFDIGQDPNTGAIDLVAAVSIKSKIKGYLGDLLYVSLGNNPSDWSNYTPTWTQVIFDDPINKEYASAPINNVYVARYNSNQFIFVDLVTDTTTKALTRYAVDPTGNVMLNTTGTKQCWIPHLFAMTVQAGTHSSFIGCGPSDKGVNGVYTLGINNASANVAALVYEPLFNQYAPTTSGFATNFDLSKVSLDVNHMAMAISARSDGFTDLFFASNGVLYFIPAEQQIENNGVLPTLTPVYSHALLNGVTSLHINTFNGQLVLWGESSSGDALNTSQLFIMECPQGSELVGAAAGVNGSAWTCPIPLLFNVVNSTTYINNQYSNSVIFAHQADGSLVQLFQDPVTSAWQERFLLSEPVDYITSVYETETYTTHIEITDDTNIPQLNLPVYVWASSPCSVYVSDANNTAAYQTLAFDKALSLTTDTSGTVTIMQPVDSIAGISYNVAVQDPTTQQWYTQVVNPLQVTAQNLSKQVPDGSKNYLDGSVPDENDNATPLVSDSTVTESQKAATSTSVYTFCQHNSDASINQDGLSADQGSWPNPATALNPVSAVKAAVAATPVAAKPKRLGKDLRFDPAKNKIWGVTFGKNAKYFEGIEAMKGMGVTLNADNTLTIATSNGALLGGVNWLEAASGHLFKWMQSEADKLESAIIQIGEDGLDCLLTIAGDVYHFVIKCMNDIAGAIHTVLNAIKMAFKELISWIGMLFNFKDILSTHAVLKNCINIYMNYASTNFGSMADQVTDAFNQLESQIDKVTGLPTSGWTPSDQTYGDTTTSKTPPSGSKSPSANYGVHHTKNNAGNSDQNYTLDPSTIGNDVFDELMNMLTAEDTNIQNAGTAILDIIKAIPHTPYTDTIKQLMGTIVNLLLNTAEDVLTTGINVIQTLMGLISNVLNATIHVPVLTYLYKKMTVSPTSPDGEDLSVLDLACLIAAIPVTIVYKLVKGSAPFPAGDATNSLLTATDMDSLCVAMNALDNVDTVEPGLLGHGSASGQGMSTLNIAGSIAAAFGTVIVNLCVFTKANLPVKMDAGQTKTSKIFSCVNAAGYMLYLLPDLITAIQQWQGTKKLTWYEQIDNVCTCIGGGKAFFDAGSAWFGEPLSDIYGHYVSPGLDFFLNLLWQVPTVALSVVQLEAQGGDWKTDINIAIALIGGTGFDMSGMYSPVLASHYYNLPPGPERVSVINADVFGIGVANTIWGVSGLLTTFDQLPVPNDPT